MIMIWVVYAQQSKKINRISMGGSELGENDWGAVRKPVGVFTRQRVGFLLQGFLGEDWPEAASASRRMTYEEPHEVAMNHIWV